jgi:hypothetical protein
MLSDMDELTWTTTLSTIPFYNGHEALPISPICAIDSARVRVCRRTIHPTTEARTMRTTGH